MAFIYKHELFSFRHQGYNLQDDFFLHQSLIFVRNLELHFITFTAKNISKAFELTICHEFTESKDEIFLMFSALI